MNFLGKTLSSPGAFVCKKYGHFYSYSSYSCVQVIPKHYEQYRRISGKVAPLTKDGVFKALFQDTQDPSKLISFLNAVQEDAGEGKIHVVEFKDTRFPAYVPGEKDVIVDIVCESKNSNGESNKLHIIEMQQVEQEGYVKRWEFYASRCFTTQLADKKRYNFLNPVHVIALMKHPCKFPNDHYLFQGKNLGKQIEEGRKISLISFFDLDPEISLEDSLLKKWLHLVKFSGSHLLNREVLSQDITLAKAIDDLKDLYETPPAPIPQRRSQGMPLSLITRKVREAAMRKGL